MIILRSITQFIISLTRVIMLKHPNYVFGPQTLMVPAKLNFGAYILDKMFTFKDKVAMINGATDERLKYSEIVQDAMNLAVSLTRMGVRKGETIAVLSENRLEFWGAVVGVVCTGAALTTISTGYVKGELIHVMNISKPKYVICSPTIYKTHEKTFKSLRTIAKIIVFGTERLRNVVMYDDLVKSQNGFVQNVNYEEFEPVDVEGQVDTLFILYSSGTTGLPKGVMLTHLNVITACSMPSSHDPKEITLTISPWYHVMGLVGVLFGFAMGRVGVYLNKFDVDLYLKTIEKYKVVQLTVVPPVLLAVSKHKSEYDLSSVKLVYSGAAPLTKDVIDDAYKKFPNIKAVTQGYGSTEMTLASIRYNYDDLDNNKIGSVGRVTATSVVKVVDIETRKPLGPNQPGEICSKGQLLMKGYVGKDLREDLDDEGFYKTGDIGYYDPDGYFFIVDRLKELIKYKGYQVPPAELEGVLLQHEGIKEAGVIGVKDKLSGEVPLAFVVPQPGKTLTEKEIQDFIAERLSNPKHLRGGVRFLQKIPTSPSGKILRKELRKILNSTKSKL